MEGKSSKTVGKLLGATIRTHESPCQCLRVCRIAREDLCFAVIVSQEQYTGKVIPVIQQRPLFSPQGWDTGRGPQAGGRQGRAVD